MPSLLGLDLLKVYTEDRHFYDKEHL